MYLLTFFEQYFLSYRVSSTSGWQLFISWRGMTLNPRLLPPRAGITSRHHRTISRCWGWNSKLHACEANTLLKEPHPQPLQTLFFGTFSIDSTLKLMELTWQSGLLIAEMGSVDRVTVCMILGLSKLPPTSRSAWKSLQRPCIQTRLEEKKQRVIKT